MPRTVRHTTPIETQSLPTTKRMGRPPKYRSEFAHTAEIICQSGGDDIALALAFKVSVRCIDVWQRMYYDFFLAIRRGKDECDSKKIENTLKRRAQGYDVVEKKDETIEIECDMIDASGAIVRDEKGKKVKVKVPANKHTEQTKHIPADMIGIIFWLTNRERDRWLNSRNVKFDGKIDGLGNNVTNNYAINLDDMPEEDLVSLRSTLSKALSNKKEKGEEGQTRSNTQQSGTA